MFIITDRQKAIAILKDFAGPLGPFESLDEQIERREVWASTADNQVIDAFLDILVHPPDQNEICPITQDSLEAELSELLVLIGQHNPSDVLEKIAPYLANEQARPTVIEVIGGLRLEAGISWLKPLIENKNLTEDELIRLACALGEIGGKEALDLLQQLRASSSEIMTDLQKEIDIAIELLINL